MDKQKSARSPAPSCGRPDLQHAARVSVLVSKLASPSLPREEAVLWAIASCDILSRAPDYLRIIPTDNLRETCEAVQEAVERASQCVSISSSLQPLGTAERAAVTMISDARRKYFYILAMSLKLKPGDNFDESRRPRCTVWDFLRSET